MAIPLLKVIQNFGKKEFSHTRGRHHLMLAGISQSLFHRNWGEPDSHIDFKKLGSLYERGSLYLTVNSDDEADYSVWIYKSRDRILFFARRKLIVHFKWSGFHQGKGRPDEARDAHGMRISSAFFSKTLALVA
jgi:hypothetical protein